MTKNGQQFKYLVLPVICLLKEGKFIAKNEFTNAASISLLIFLITLFTVIATSFSKKPSVYLLTACGENIMEKMKLAFNLTRSFPIIFTFFLPQGPRHTFIFLFEFNNCNTTVNI